MHSTSHSRTGSGIHSQGHFTNEQADYHRTRPNTDGNNDTSRNHENLLPNNPQTNFTSPPQAIGPKNNSKINCWYRVRSVICIVEWIVNLVTNLGLFAIFLICGEIKFAAITLAIFVCGKLVVHILSATWRSADISQDEQPKNYSGWDLFLSDLFLGLFPRYQMILDFAKQIRDQLRKNRNSHLIQDIETAIKQEEFDLIVLRVIETFLTVAPQLVVQLVIYWQLRGMEIEVAQPDKREYLELSVMMLIVISVCNVVLTLWMYNSVLKDTFKDWLVSLHCKEAMRKQFNIDQHFDMTDFMENNEEKMIKEHHIHRTARISFVLAFSSSFAFMISRVVALCAMIFLCSQSTVWMVGGVLIFICHIFVIFFALSYQGSQFTGFENEQEVVFRLIMSFIYTFYFLPIQREKLRIKVSLYNIVTGIENLIMILILFRIGSNVCDKQAKNLKTSCENVLSTKNYEQNRCPSSPGFEDIELVLYRDYKEESCESIFGYFAVYGVAIPWAIGLILYIINYFVLDPRRKFRYCFGKKEEERTDADLIMKTPQFVDKTFDLNQQNGQSLQYVQNIQNYQTTSLLNQTARPLPVHYLNQPQQNPQQYNSTSQTRQGVPPPPLQQFDDNGPTHVSLNTLQHLYMDKLGLTSPMGGNGKAFNLNTIDENSHSLTPIQQGSRAAFQKQASVMSQGTSAVDRPELHTFGRGNRPVHASKTRADQVNKNNRNRLTSKSHSSVPKNRTPTLPNN